MKITNAILLESQKVYMHYTSRRFVYE